MITYTQLGNYGRLGNQLFQYAALRSVSLETGYEMKIPPIEHTEFHNQTCQLTKFNIRCSYLTESDYRSLRYRFVEPDHTKFWPQLFRVGDHTDLFGYFQNYQYFAKHEAVIRNDFELEKRLSQYASDYVRSLAVNNEQIVSVHIRRGDLTDGTNPVHGNYYGSPTGSIEDSVFGKYFFKALQEFDNIRCRFLVFTGGSRAGDKNNQSDVEWCKRNLKDDRFVFSEKHSDIQDFAIMKNCDHHITTHMTSFGYWAALLNDNSDKVVVAPQNYTIPDDGRAKYGFYPNKWKLIL